MVQTVIALATQVAVNSAPKPSFVTQQVTVTATVSSDGGVPMGTVNFGSQLAADAGPEAGAYMDAGTVAIGDGGTAAVAISTLAVGAHNLRAIYLGSPIYASATGQNTHAVNKAAATTTLVSSANPSNVGQSVTFTAAVTSVVAGVSGTVDFFDGATKIGSGTLDAAGKATFATSTLTQGGHAMSAVYSGDAIHATSTSPELTQNVGQDAGTQPPPPPPPPPAGGGPAVDAGVPGAAADLSGSGCDCRTAPVTSEALGLAPLAGLALLWARRRRRFRS
jgi:MYXO-CTERM domain-containing protein